MKKVIILMLMLLSVVGMVFAGSLENYAYNNNADETSDNNVTVDADTLEGNSASVFATMSYISSQDSRWTSDSRGMNKESLSRYLSGDKNLFDKFDTFIDFLKDIFVTNDRVDKLEKRLDVIEAQQSGVSIDAYQKSRAIKEGSYGAYTCADDLCIKRIN